MRFYVIGSCRVHGPLRGRPGYQPALPGYTHTAKEAIQRIRFLCGELKIPDSVSPYVFSLSRAPAVTHRHRQALDRSDVVLVEICSAKEVSLDGYWLNLNYAKDIKSDVREAEDLEGDIKTLALMCKRLMVVQHVELPGISDRSRFASQLRDVCEKLGVPVFVPADYVTPEEMLDVNHYRPEAVGRIGDRLMEFMACKQAN